MKPTIKSHFGLKPLTTGIGALLLALASVHLASAQSNTGTGLNVNVVTTNGVAAALSITTGVNNTAYGLDALRFDTTGSGNTAVGSAALRSNVGGGSNTGVGYGALYLNNATANTALGTLALRNNTSGASNAALGYLALYSNTTGSLNTATGREALYSNIDGTNNVANGFQALLKNTSGDFNVAIGDGALLNNTIGSGNIGIGEDAGVNLTTGSNNIRIGNKTGGAATENGIIRIGASPTHTDTYLAGVIHGDGSLLTNIPAGSVTGQIATAQIANAAVNSAKLASNLTLGGTTTGTFTGNLTGNASTASSAFNFTGALSGNVTGTQGATVIANAAVTTARIADAAVTTVKIANAAVTSTKIANAAVTTTQIANTAVTSAKLAIGLTLTGTTVFTGNVGIGTSTPGLRLDVEGPQASGRFVSTSTANGSVIELKNLTASPTFLGGINFNNAANTNPGSIAYLANDTLKFDVAGAERMQIAANGNVGIGTSNPESGLHVEATQASGLFVSTSTANGSVIELKNLTASPTFLGGINFNNAANANPGSIAYLADDSLHFYVAGTDQMAILSDGSVGIGTTDPLAGLHIKNWGEGVRIDGPGTGAANVAYVSFNDSSGTRVGYVGDSSASDSNVYLASDGGDVGLATDWGAVLTATRDGMVGIGTSTPTRGLLEIDGVAGSFDYTARGFLTRAGASTTTFPGTATGICVWASGSMYASSFVAYSDERIKNIDGRSDAARDLSTLLGIEVTDYTYIDTVSKGAGKQKKVIAQQVEKVYPEAVSLATEVVPDIYQQAEFKDGWVNLATNLKKGERVRLIGNKKQGIHEVLEVEEGRFRTDFAADGDTVFVYGREVKDFRAVDYEAIAMLNVSATQQINTEVKALQDENAALRARLDAQDKRLAALEARGSRVVRGEVTPGKRPARVSNASNASLSLR